jgi:cobalt-zinc-cadmium efflux system outer membrane protein
MLTRAQACAWIAGVSLIVPSVGMAQDRSDREVVDLIVREGPRARALKTETEVTRRAQLARLAYPNPSVLYSREGAGFTEFLQLEQPLPFAGPRASLSRAGVAATAVTEAETNARLAILRAEAATGVARLLAEQERLQIGEAHAREVARLIDVLRTRELEGEGSRFDRLRAEQELRDARQLVTAAAIALADARATVSALLPRDVQLGRIVRAQPPAQLAPEIDALLTRARSTRAELRALERAGHHARLEAVAARRARLPAATVFGGLKRADDESGRQSGAVLGVNLALPLFDAGGRDAARWDAERARVDAERVAMEDQIRAEVTRASESLRLRMAAVSEDQGATGDELLQIAEVAYREGEVGILELLDAVRTASRTRTRTIGIRLDARLAQIALERAVGDVLWP